MTDPLARRTAYYWVCTDAFADLFVCPFHLDNLRPDGNRIDASVRCHFGRSAGLQYNRNRLDRIRTFLWLPAGMPVQPANRATQRSFACLCGNGCHRRYFDCGPPPVAGCHFLDGSQDPVRFFHRGLLYRYRKLVAGKAAQHRSRAYLWYLPDG